jgi:tetratricopeptide (TPR) repeat protein
MGPRRREATRVRPSSGDSADQAAGLARQATMSWLRVGSAGDSPALFQRAFAADEDCVEAHYGVGLVALACGDLPTAQKAFARVLALDADQANAAYHLGLVAEARGNLGEATRFYRRSAVPRPRTRTSDAAATAAVRTRGGREY